ncbi:protein terminal ear1 like [Fagus crenata]
MSLRIHSYLFLFCFTLLLQACLSQNSTAPMAGWISHLNPYAQEFFPIQNPQLIIASCPSVPTSHQYYLSSQTTNFYYDSTYRQSLSISETIYTNTYFQTIQPSLLPVTEPTIPFVYEPPEQPHVVHHEAKVDQKMVAQKVNPKRYRNRHGGRESGRVRKTLWARCGNSSESFGSPDENENRNAPKVESLNKYARGVGAYAFAKAKKRNCSPVLPVHIGALETTVMIRNIPNKYTREMLVAFLDYHCMLANRKADKSEEHTVSEFDFVYLPIDFSTGFNKGYAFVNFTKPQAVWNFYKDTDKQTWDLFNSHKKREIALARIQGKDELLSHFQSVEFPCQSDQVLPVCFEPPRDGSRKLVTQKTLGNCTTPREKAGSRRGIMKGAGTIQI